MLCRVEMPRNEQIHGRFYRYSLLHPAGGRRGLAGQFALLAVLVVLCVFLFIGGASPLVPAALLVVAAAYCIYLLWGKPGLSFRAQPGAALVTEVTVFTGAGLTHSARSEEGGLPENRSLPYGALLKAAETAQDFYLFTAPAQAIQIDKDYFTNGTPDELRAVLKKELGGKFKTRY